MRYDDFRRSDNIDDRRDEGGGYGGGGGFIVEDRTRYSGVLQASASAFTFNQKVKRVSRGHGGHGGHGGGGCGCN